MEKLEAIIDTEESARHAVSEARARARAIKKDAIVEAERAAARVDTEAAQRIAAARTKILKEAGARAAEIEREAEHELADVVSSAESRLDAAVRAVVTDLIGG